VSQAATDIANTEEAATAEQKFVHLHNHSHYSLLDGLQKVPGMLDRIAELGMRSVALTDHGTLSGAIEFYKEARKRDIKPIIGIETYVAPRKHTDKEGRQDANPYHLILLAYNDVGYHNLMKLSSIAMLDGFYYKARVDHDLLVEYHEGLIALSACAGGEVATNLRAGNMPEAESVARWYDETFGRGNYYLELQDHAHQWDEQRLINEGLIELSKKTGIPMVVTADSHYSRHGDKEAHEILLCVQTGKTMADTDRMSMSMDLCLTSPEDVMARWSHIPEVYENTVKIAERCEIFIPLDRILIPTFPVPEEGMSEKEYLHQLCWQGLAWRYGNIPKEDIALMTQEKAKEAVAPEVSERLEYELDVIGRMGYDGYFLMVSDLINWGKNQGIVFGPGRGSAAGSIVAYVMNITDLDPLKYDLLFERFLNPDRVSMPDIDIDIQDTRRGEVIDYVTEKYGQERVAQIITFGTMAARNSVRDTGRALGMSYDEVDAIAKLVPQPVQGRHIPLAVSVGLKTGKTEEQVTDPDLQKAYKSSPRVQQLIDLAIQLEGTVRSNGIHAAAVVIAPEPLVGYTPLQRAQKGGICTQYEMHAVEELGLLKMDFLGLSNLTVINNCLRIVKKVYGQSIDISEIPLDDEPTYELLTRADTTGVFQLESAGMKRYLKDLKPTVFDDIISMVALYRPGPIQWIDDFIERKHGRREITYLHPAMENALKSTYGVIVTQEQAMQIAKEMCGFTGGQADTLRKAIGKKDAKLMAKIKEDFIEGAIKTVGADRSLMETLWAQLEAFAAYCFNKAHSACYGLIAYQTAYLKAHFPAAFMAALLTSDYGNIDRIAIEVAEVQRMGIKMLPPDVNESFLEFSVGKDKQNIRFGMSAIKNVGTGAIEAILAARAEGGPFSSIEDFAKRVNARECNKKVWESLAKTGAFDSLVDGDRGKLLNNLELVVAYSAKAQKNALSGQIDIFGSLGVEENLPALRLDPPAIATSSREYLAWERDLMGLYLSHHPLDEYANFLAKSVVPISTINNDSDGKLVRIGGLITIVRKITTKNGGNMAFVQLEDRTGTIELVVFPKAYDKSPEVYTADNIIMVAGNVSRRDRDGGNTGEPKVMVDTAKVIDYETAIATKAPPPRPEPKPAPAPRPTVVASSVDTQSPEADKGNYLVLKIADLSDPKLLHDIKAILDGHAGASEIYIVVGQDAPKTIRLPFKVELSDELVNQLGELVGEGQVTNQL
jgi:DNA polymerase-3 subunit alpha